LALQKVTKKSLIPEGDFRARGRHETTDKVEANAQSQRFLNFTAITDRNQNATAFQEFFITTKELSCVNERWLENPR
jgi:hypothetical protein